MGVEEHILHYLRTLATEGARRAHARVEQVPVVGQDADVAGPSQPLVLATLHVTALELVAEAVELLAAAGVGEQAHRHDAVGMLGVHEAVDVFLIVLLEFDLSVLAVVLGDHVRSLPERGLTAEALVEVVTQPPFVTVLLLLLDAPPEGGWPPLNDVRRCDHLLPCAVMLCRIAVLSTHLATACDQSVATRFSLTCVDTTLRPVWALHRTQKSRFVVITSKRRNVCFGTSGWRVSRSHTRSGSPYIHTLLRLRDRHEIAENLMPFDTPSSPPS